MGAYRSSVSVVHSHYYKSPAGGLHDVWEQLRAWLEDHTWLRHYGSGRGWGGGVGMKARGETQICGIQTHGNLIKNTVRKIQSSIFL